MADVSSTAVDRVYMTGVGSRMAIFRLRGVSSGDSFNASTTFANTGTLSAVGFQAASTGRNCTLQGTSQGFTFAGVAGWNGLANGIVYVMAQGAGAP